MHFRNMMLILIVMTPILNSLYSCKQNEQVEITIRQKPFGELADGRQVHLFTLKNQNEMELAITNFGGIVQKLVVPDKNGDMGDIVLGYDNLDGYIKDVSYIGALIGRYGNRIANARFELNGQSYTLAANNGPNHLHGGVKGFHKVLWNAKPIEAKDRVSLELSYTSKDGEEGYPGTLQVTVVYSLTADNQVEIDYRATTDKPTICNLTNHTYFNLKDAGASPILDHSLRLDADQFTPVDAALIPTGEIIPVAGTPFDFSQGKKIGQDIEQADEQLTFGQGYDHNFVVKGKMGMLNRVARLSEPTTGRILEIFSTEPAIQFYSGNFLDGRIIGKSEMKYQFRTGLCLEPQHYPDSPNQPAFPSTTLNPGEQYHTKTIWKFSVEK